MKTQEENLKTYQWLIRVNRVIEENRPEGKILIWMFKVAFFFPLKLRKVKKELRNEFITYLIRAFEYDHRKKCGYELTYEQKAFCFRVNWMTSILAGFSVVNVGMPVGMPWEGEYDGEKVRRSE